MFKFVEIDPPGSICQTAAILQLVRESRARTFVEVGCGGGRLSQALLEEGLTGIGVDSSTDALAIARQNLNPSIENGAFELIDGNVMDPHFSLNGAYDIVLAIMVMEHIEEDVEFLRKLATFAQPGGMILVAVPGRMDRWGIEDETVGHVRRYERDGLLAIFAEAAIMSPKVWSVSVPVANICFHLGNVLIRCAGETEKLAQSPVEQTASSGIRRIPFKTVFPRFFRLLLNPVTMLPLIWLQRAFYSSSKGLTLLGFGRIK